jgi:hypothetical protein
MFGHSRLISLGNFAFFSASVNGAPDAISKQRRALTVPLLTARSSEVGLAAAALPKSRFSPLADTVYLCFVT